MDLHLIQGAIATPEERAAIDAAVAAHAGADVPGERHLMLPALHAVNARVGWISEGALNHICARLSIPPAEAYGVASFYALFSLEPRPPRVVRVCDDIACRAAGAAQVCEDLAARVGLAGTPVLGGGAVWVRSPCLGQCAHGPAALCHVAGEEPASWSIVGADAEAIAAAMQTTARVPPSTIASAPQTASRDRVGLRLLRRIGVVDPESLDDYRAHGGYQALRRALDLGPARVLAEVSASGLSGRGGAAFPTGRKWAAVATAAVRPHYLICNADESEPGTFKDRVLLEEDPFAIVEAMTIAGCATGCELGIIYIRGEYPLAAARLRGAVDQARRRGLVGDDVMGRGVRFEIELRRGAGAYICGEETALFNSVEGFRGEPRNKPPFPTDAGLFGKPTLVNNVETLANVLDIVCDGGEAFARIGAPGSTGTKLFCVSGSAARPGVYEVPFGTTLRALIDLAGGVPRGRTLRAVLVGGAAGTFLTADELDLPLTLDDARRAGAAIGSGVVMLFDDTVDLSGIVLRIAEFFRDESCGQCVPCRIGTVRQEEALRRGDLAVIDDLAQAMRDASICGLGQTASLAVQSAIRKLKIFATVSGDGARA